MENGGHATDPKGVAPLAGAWVEMLSHIYDSTKALVAPLAGAWVEIAICLIEVLSLSVAPLAGAWVEIQVNTS